MTPRPFFRAMLLGLPVLLAACGGAGDHAASSGATKSDTLRDKIWTPQQARAIRNAQQHPATEPAASAANASAPQEDSATWARAESLKFEQRKRAMGSYASCAAQAQGVAEPIRSTILNACRHAPGAPK